MPPFTPEELTNAVRKSASRGLRKLSHLIADDPTRTPYGLRKPYKQDAWEALTTKERVEHARGILKAQAFDELVASRGVNLSGTPAL